MRDALMTERSGPACIILRRVKKAGGLRRAHSDLLTSRPDLASQKRFELPTPRLGGVCSIQLSYWDIYFYRIILAVF